MIGGKRGQIEAQFGGKLMQCLLETRQVKHESSSAMACKGVIIKTSNNGTHVKRRNLHGGGSSPPLRHSVAVKE
ncbi:hypothetical protein J4732_08115 [Serratia marcescens]|uniref:Uncharacterized protein n=1 Tax=Serratia marcescens TaxID=615 RepID=A0A939NRC7_SERMA|nr:hypothetical protein [Serratia marcescens]